MFLVTKARAGTALVIAATAISASNAYALPSYPTSPSARDAAREATASQGRDARLPDAVDRARAREISRPEAPSVPRLQVVEASSRGFEWGDAGIGAAGVLALVSVGTGAAMLLSRRRRGGGHPVATG
jgi:hypothetical protein